MLWVLAVMHKVKGCERWEYTWRGMRQVVRRKGSWAFQGLEDLNLEN